MVETARLTVCAGRAPFVNPVTTRTCAHTFCLDCIHTALGITAQCPVDRSSLTVLDLRAANPILRNVRSSSNPLGCLLTIECSLWMNSSLNVCIVKTAASSYVKGSCSVHTSGTTAHSRYCRAGTPAATRRFRADIWDGMMRHVWPGLVLNSAVLTVACEFPPANSRYARQAALRRFSF